MIYLQVFLLLILLVGFVALDGAYISALRRRLRQEVREEVLGPASQASGFLGRWQADIHEKLELRKEVSLLKQQLDEKKQVAQGGVLMSHHVGTGERY
jgi:hypothetical protein